MNKLIDTKGLKRAIENIKSFINKNYITEVTYEELVELRNNSKLIPGKQYRIIDYITTTVQENTRSAGHQFDIIVTADDEKTLNENARAIQHKGDTYFNTSNLNAWEIKYNLDNDKKYSWAKNINSNNNCRVILLIDPNDDNFRYIYARKKEYDKDKKFAYMYLTEDTDIDYIGFVDCDSQISDIIYLEQEYPNIDDMLDNGYVVKDVSWGKGVIYYMKDEYNNEAPYDFKNIQYKYGLHENGTPTDDLQDADFIKYLYTFSWLDAISYDSESKDCSVIGNDGTISDDENNTKLVYNNTINTTFFRSINNISSLPFVIFLSNSEYDSGIFYGYHGNVIEKDCSNIRFLNQCHYNHISDSYRIDLSNESDNNNILKANRCYIRGFYNFIYGSGDNIEHHIEIIGDNNKIYRSEVIKIRGDYNIVEDGCYDIICGKNNHCSHNIFKSHCKYITFGNNYYCDHNILYENCKYVTLGKNNTSNHNIIKNDCTTITINGGYNVIHNYCRSITINGDGSIVNKECVGINSVSRCYVGERNYFINFTKSNYTPNDVIGRYIGYLEKLNSIPFRSGYPGLYKTFNKGDIDVGNYKYSLSAENNNDVCVITLKISFRVYVNDFLRLNDYEISSFYVYHPDYDRVEFTIDDVILNSANEELAVTITMVPVNDDDILDVSNFVEYFTEAEFDNQFYIAISAENSDETFHITSEA